MDGVTSVVSLPGSCLLPAAAALVVIQDVGLMDSAQYCRQRCAAASHAKEYHSVAVVTGSVVPVCMHLQVVQHRADRGIHISTHHVIAFAFLLTPPPPSTS